MYKLQHNMPCILPLMTPFKSAQVVRRFYWLLENDLFLFLLHQNFRSSHAIQKPHVQQE